MVILARLAMALGCWLVDRATRHLPMPALPDWDEADLERCMECRAARRVTNSAEVIGND